MSTMLDERTSAPTSQHQPQRAFRALGRAQWKAFIRDKETLFWLMAFPLMFLLLFGFINSGSGDRTSKSDVITVGEVQFVKQLPADARKQFDELFDTEPAKSRDDALEKLRKGSTDAVLEQSGNRLILHYSSADQVKAATVRGTMNSFVDGTNIAVAGVKPTYQLASQQVEDSSLQPIQYLTPGLLGFALAMGGTFGGALTLVAWRKTQLLRRMRLTPTSPWAMVASRVVVSVIIALLQFVAFVTVAKLLFGLQLTGAWWMALPLVLCGTLVFMAIGLIAGAISKTEEAASGLANLIVLPMSFLGGSFIPLEFAPDWLKTVANILPMGHLTNGLMDVMVRGEGPSAALLPMAILLGFAAVFTLIAAKVFRWED